MANDSAPKTCPRASDGVIQGIIWGTVILIIVFSIIGRCWYKDRKHLNELREARVQQLHLHRREEDLRANGWDVSRSPPPPPYHGDDRFEMDQFYARSQQTYDLETHGPIAPDRVILRESRRAVF
jgi:hypothetical protein